MGYTTHKPNLNAMKKNDFDENLKKLEQEIERRRKQQCNEQMGYYDPHTLNFCGATVCEAPKYVDAYDANGYACAKVVAAHMPNGGINYERYDDWSNATIDHLRNENRQLVSNIQKVLAQNAQLVDEINRLRRENIELKTKKSKKKDFDIKVYDSLNKVGNGFSGLYQKFITWLNT